MDLTASCLEFCMSEALVTVLSCVAAVEAFIVDEINRGGTGAVKQQLLIVLVLVLLLHLFLQELVALPQRGVLDPFDLPTQLKHNTLLIRSHSDPILFSHDVFSV